MEDSVLGENNNTFSYFFTYNTMADPGAGAGAGEPTSTGTDNIKVYENGLSGKETRVYLFRRVTEWRDVVMDYFEGAL